MCDVYKGAVVYKLLADLYRQFAAFGGVKFAAQLLHQIFYSVAAVAAIVIGAVRQCVCGKIILRVAGGRCYKGFGVNIPVAAAQVIIVAVGGVNFKAYACLSQLCAASASSGSSCRAV